MGGGLSLGNAVKSSGLLALIAGGISGALRGQSLFVISLAFNAFVGILANFISSTVAAIILLPIIAQVGSQTCEIQPDGSEVCHARMLVVGATLMCSGAMGLPVSSFPNANSMSARTKDNAPFLATSDYVKTGFPMAVVRFLHPPPPTPTPTPTPTLPHAAPITLGAPRTMRCPTRADSLASLTSTGIDHPLTVGRLRPVYGAGVVDRSRARPLIIVSLVSAGHLLNLQLHAWNIVFS